MKLIIGLGNPGKKYEHTRHNAGFMLVDKLRETWNLPDFSAKGGSASGWEFNKKFNAEISEGIYVIHDTKYKILLAKPATFMNNSGEAVKKIIAFYKLTPADIIIIHDDLDIELGKYKISEDSRAAGHNGVQSIIDCLGTQNFKRIRIGIEGEEKRKSRIIPSEDFVLKDFSPKDKATINEVLETISKYFIKNI